MLILPTAFFGRLVTIHRQYCNQGVRPAWLPQLLNAGSISQIAMKNVLHLKFASLRDSHGASGAVIDD
jgi:hypothetical protein